MSSRYDARRHGRRAVPGADVEQAMPVLESLDMLLATVADVRRVVDHLAGSRPGPIGLLGFSLGAHVGLLAAAADPRLDPVCLLGASFPAISDDPAQYPASAPDPEALRAKVAGVDVLAVLGQLTDRHLLFVRGRDDAYVEVPAYQEAVRRLRAAGGRVDEWLHEGEHDPTPAVLAAAMAWLAAQLTPTA